MLTALLVAIPGAAVAGPFEEGVEAWFHNDYATALRLWRPLADQGDANAQMKLGLMYELGQGVPKNNAEALKWWRLAAGHDATAQFLLGSLYYDGSDSLSLAQDYAEAAKWYLRAANQGEHNAQLNLGRMYEKGHGVPQDYALAHMWLNLAAAAASAAQGSFNYPAFIRDNLAGRMTPAQIAEAQKLAREWKPKPERQ
jgi:uncharacterized protein